MDKEAARSSAVAELPAVVDHSAVADHSAAADLRAAAVDHMGMASQEEDLQVVVASAAFRRSFPAIMELEEEAVVVIQMAVLDKLLQRVVKELKTMDSIKFLAVQRMRSRS